MVKCYQLQNSKQHHTIYKYLHLIGETGPHEIPSGWNNTTLSSAFCSYLFFLLGFLVQIVNWASLSFLFGPGFLILKSFSRTSQKSKPVCPMFSYPTARKPTYFLEHILWAPLNSDQKGILQRPACTERNISCRKTKGSWDWKESRRSSRASSSVKTLPARAKFPS